MNYLKIILTIIAIDLTMIVLQNANLVPIAKAEQKSGTIDVNIHSIGGSAIYGNEVPVKIQTR